MIYINNILNKKYYKTLHKDFDITKDPTCSKQRCRWSSSVDGTYRHGRVTRYGKRNYIVNRQVFAIINCNPYKESNRGMFYLMVTDQHT